MSRVPHILVVDDEAIIRNIVARLVHALGYSALTASNGTEALSLIRQHKPELILLDIVMPGVESMEVLKTIRSDSELNGSMVVLISSTDEPDTIAKYIEAGANDFLPKPFNKTLLELKIINCLKLADTEHHLAQLRESRDEFCRRLSHDINNSLTGIVMTAEMLMMQDQPEPVASALTDITESAERIPAIIREQRHAICSEGGDNPPAGPVR